MWSDWHTTNGVFGPREETLDLATGEHITSISGYSYDEGGTTDSLQAETSAGRQWGPFGDHRDDSDNSLRSSPPTSSGLRLHHLSGDQSENIMILRWLQLKNH